MSQRGRGGEGAVRRGIVVEGVAVEDAVGREGGFTPNGRRDADS